MFGDSATGINGINFSSMKFYLVEIENILLFSPEFFLNIFQLEESDIRIARSRNIRSWQLIKRVKKKRKKGKKLPPFLIVVGTGSDLVNKLHRWQIGFIN